MQWNLAKRSHQILDFCDFLTLLTVDRVDDQVCVKNTQTIFLAVDLLVDCTLCFVQSSLVWCMAYLVKRPLVETPKL